MLSFHIARRFLWRSRLQSVLIVAGIGVGIGTQIFVGSLISSLQASLIDTTVGSSAHVTLTASEDGERLAWTDALASRLGDDPAIAAVVPQHRLPMLAQVGSRTDPIVVRIADADERDEIYDLSSRMVEGSASPGGGELLVGVDYAEDVGVGLGDTIRLLTEAGVPFEAEVAGIFDLGVAAVNAGTAFGTRDLAPALLDLPADAVDLVELQVGDVFASDAVAADLRTLEGVAASDWQAENRELLTGLQSQSVSSIMIQVFVVIAVGLGIASTLAIAAVQKTRQIGILKALGLTDRGSGAVFLWQAVMLGAGGTALGIGVGWGLIAGFDRASAGSAALFPVSVDPAFAALSAGVGLSIALLSAVIPYRSTSRVDPIEVIQGG